MCTPRRQHAIDLVERDRIVEVLGICRIDGEDVTHAQVMPTMLGKGCLHIDFDRLGLLERLGAKLRGQVKVVDDDVDVHARSIRRTEHFDDVALHGLVTIGIARDAREHDVTVLGTLQTTVRDKEIVAHARVLGDDHGERVVDLERADEVFGRAAHDAHHPGRTLRAVRDVA